MPTMLNLTSSDKDVMLEKNGYFSDLSDKIRSITPASVKETPELLEKWEKIQKLDLRQIKFKMSHPSEPDRWSVEKVNNAELLYKTFLFLNIAYPNDIFTPSQEIDTFWHHHVTDTRKYEQDCLNIFGEFLHHFPYFGLRGDKDEQNLKNAFEKTKATFKKEFDIEIDPSSSCAGCCSGRYAFDDPILMNN